MMSSQPSPKTASKEELQLLWRMTGLAFQFGTEIIAGVLIGWGVDALFGTRPWGIVIGAIVGIAVGTLDLTRKAIAINRQMDRADKAAGGKKAGGAPIRPAEDQSDTDVLDAEFEEALDHEQWKRAQDRKFHPDSDEDDLGHGTGESDQKG